MACACRTRIVLPFVIIGSLLGLAIAIFGGGIVNAIVKLVSIATGFPFVALIRQKTSIAVTTSDRGSTVKDIRQLEESTTAYLQLFLPVQYHKRRGTVAGESSSCCQRSWYVSHTVASHSSTGSYHWLSLFQLTGPFVFREERQKINYTFLSDGSVVEYNQTRTFHFVPELSLPLDTQIYHLNVPLIVSLLLTTMCSFY